jgi:maleamate amidohydrolase
MFSSTARQLFAMASYSTVRNYQSMHMQNDLETYQRQSFGTKLQPKAPVGLLIVDFVNSFANPDRFGGGNIAQAIANTVPLLAFAREERWPVAHTRIVFADDDSDHNIFCEKVPGMLTLKEHDHDSMIVDELAPREGELVVRKTVPSAFFGTSLFAWLAQRGVQTLVIAGAVTSGCVRASVVDAMQFGFRPFVISDCVGDRAIGPHDANLFDMAQKYAAVMPRDEAISLLASL